MDIKMEMTPYIWNPTSKWNDCVLIWRWNSHWLEFSWGVEEVTGAGEGWGAAAGFVEGSWK